MLWEAGTVFARWLHRYAQPAGLLEGQRVLELCSGSTGLCGLAAWQLGAEHVVLSDYIPELVAQLGSNIARNAAASTAGSIEACSLDLSTVGAQGFAALRNAAGSALCDARGNLRVTPSMPCI